MIAREVFLESDGVELGKAGACLWHFAFPAGAFGGVGWWMARRCGKGAVAGCGGFVPGVCCRNGYRGGVRESGWTVRES